MLHVTSLFSGPWLCWLILTRCAVRQMAQFYTAWLRRSIPITGRNKNKLLLFPAEMKMTEVVSINSTVRPKIHPPCTNLERGKVLSTISTVTHSESLNNNKVRRPLAAVISLFMISLGRFNSSRVLLETIKTIHAGSVNSSVVWWEKNNILWALPLGANHGAIFKWICNEYLLLPIRIRFCVIAFWEPG